MILTLIFMFWPGLVSLVVQLDQFSKILFAVCRVAVGEGTGDLELENEGVGRGLGHMKPTLGIFFPSRMAVLGVSFGLVACLLGLVLGLCFATEFLVSGSLSSVL
jgi:hypothetical protein